jgi:hypothetical protein
MKALSILAFLSTISLQKVSDAASHYSLQNGYCFVSQALGGEVKCSTPIVTEEAPSTKRLEGFQKVRATLLDKLLSQYEEYQAIYSYQKVFALELDEIDLRDKERAKNGFVRNQPLNWNVLQSMTPDQQLEARHKYEKDTLEHNKDEARRNQIGQLNYESQMHHRVKQKLELISKLRNSIYELQEMIDSLKGYI